MSMHYTAPSCGNPTGGFPSDAARKVEFVERLMTNRIEHYQARIWKNTRKLFLWSGAWAVTIALMAFGPKFLWHQALGFTLLAIGLNVCVGIGLIIAHKQYLMAMDELQRKVMLNAMAITLGVGLIAIVPFSLMSRYHLIPFKAD